MLTINALAAADSVVILVQAHYLPLKGMTQLVKTIGKVQRQINPRLSIDGVLLTLADMRTTLARTTADDLLFSTQAERDEAGQEAVRNIPLEEISDFPGHPFKVKLDENMMDMAESVKHFLKKLVNRNNKKYNINNERIDRIYRDLFYRK